MRSESPPKLPTRQSKGPIMPGPMNAVQDGKDRSSKRIETIICTTCPLSLTLLTQTTIYGC